MLKGARKSLARGNSLTTCNVNARDDFPYDCEGELKWRGRSDPNSKFNVTR